MSLFRFIFIILINIINYSFAEDIDSALYLKAFGDAIISQTINIPLYIGRIKIGEISSKIDSQDNILNINKDSLLIVLTPILEDHAIDSIRTLPDLISPKDLNFKLKYYPDKMIINADIPATIMRSTAIGRLNNEESGQISSPLSLIINTVTSGESETFSHEKKAMLETDSYLNINSYLINNRTRHVRSNISEPVNERLSTNLGKDIYIMDARYTLGDTSNKTLGYLSSTSILGASLDSGYTFKNTSQGLNDNEYIVSDDSTIKFYVNEVLVKTFKSPRGKYTMEDLSLAAGENIIRVEVIDIYGVKNQFIYKNYMYANLLKKAQTKYSLSVGERSLKKEGNLTYDPKDVISTLTLERGLTNNFTGKIYKQTSKKYNIDGIEGILASSFGVMNIGSAYSRSESSGPGVSSIIGMSNEFKLGHFPLRTNLSRELIGRNFSTSDSSADNKYNIKDRISISTSLSDRINLNLNLDQLKYRDDSIFKKDYVKTIGLRYSPSNTISTSINLSERSHGKEIDKAILVGLNLTFGDSRISTQYRSQDNELTESYDQKIKFNKNTDSTISIGHSDKHGERLESSSDSISSGFNYNGRYSNFSIGGSLNRSRSNVPFTNNGRVNKTAKIRASSSIISAYDNGNFGFSIAPTVSDSAAIVVLNKGGEDQLVKLMNRGDVMAKKGLFGELVDNNLVSRTIQNVSIDSSELDSDYVIDNETARLSPSPHSVSLIQVGRLGGYSLKGRIHDKKGKPIANKVGKLHASNNTAIDFFTNDNGLFYAEAVPHGEIELSLDRGAIKLPTITIKEAQKGLVDLGILTVP